MEENEEKLDTQNETEITYETSTVQDFVELVRCISEYYNVAVNDDFEEWKYQSGHIKKSHVPNQINRLVEKAFRIQLKKFVD